jgi:replicative DNA helicase
MSTDSSLTRLDETLRLPPHHHEIEQGLLSILLYNNQNYERLPDGFVSDFFYDPIHQKIFQAIQHLIQKGRVANPVTLSAFFQGPEAQEVQKTLAQLGSSLVPSVNLVDYALQIYDLYLRRQLVSLSQNIQQGAFDVKLEGPDAKKQIEAIEAQLYFLSALGHERSAQPFSSALQVAISSAEKAYQRDGHIVGVTTGFIDLDKLLGGLHPSDLLILAGRPSMGKTALATNIAFNAALTKLKKKDSSGAGVAFFSLEMSAEQLAMRLLGQESGIPSDRIRRGAIDQKSFSSFLEVARNLSDLPLFIDDTPALSVSSLLARARRLKRKEDIGLIVIDYLQLLTSGRNQAESRVQELSEITRGLKALAKELNVPVLALSQLSRAVELREDKRPQLADLRESGSIEQDADVVMFVYREEYYEERKKPSAGSDKMSSWQEKMSSIYNLAEVVIAKQRHGPISNVLLHFDGQKTRFSNYVKPNES